jgi:hypothetical protein
LVLVSIGVLFYGIFDFSHVISSTKWPKAPGRILTSQIVQPRSRYHPSIRYAYVVGNTTYTGNTYRWGYTFYWKRETDGGRGTSLCSGVDRSYFLRSCSPREICTGTGFHGGCPFPDRVVPATPRHRGMVGENGLEASPGPTLDSIETTGKVSGLTLIHRQPPHSAAGTPLRLGYCWSPAYQLQMEWNCSEFCCANHG